MKKIAAVFIVFFLILSVCELQARPCIGCSESLPDNATFCAKCMTPQPTQVMAKSSGELSQRERILNIFSFLDEYEGNLHQLKYLNIIGRMPELKTRFNNTIQQYKRVEDRVPPELKLLVQLYASKFQIFEGLAGIMKNLRMDAGYKTAIIQSNLLTLALYNKIIDQFRVEKNYTQKDIAGIQWQMANVLKRTQKYTVTSKYLQLGEEKIPGNAMIMVMEVSGNRGLVMHVGPSMNNSPTQGWVGLRSLEKRTTWQKENIDFYQ